MPGALITFGETSLNEIHVSCSTSLILLRTVSLPSGARIGIQINWLLTHVGCVIILSYFNVNSQKMTTQYWLVISCNSSYLKFFCTNKVYVKSVTPFILY